jgi:hypothetical protein
MSNWTPSKVMFWPLSCGTAGTGAGTGVPVVRSVTV